MDSGDFEVYRSLRRAHCDERALVLRAVGIDSEVGYIDGHFVVLVDPAYGAAALEELERYSHENRGWPAPPPQPLQQRSAGWTGVFGPALP